jgi:ATP-dependent RNA helicase SUPV3L1/SUV3
MPRQSKSPVPSSPVTAVLGPTNTGKTHLAVERMLAHGGGMIGLPLRLLAREIYDRVRAKAGNHAVALITGEEKIIPAEPRYWVATVEAMPPDVRVPFVAIDEVQLAQDFERGHIFTDRILNQRGTDETMLLGAGTMRPILEKLLPRTNFISRPRFSNLTYAGQKKLTRLPPRTAIVAFTAEMVYTVAELIRQQRGGAAVVLGALSPRTRNAQVALFQSGEVDYIVATDAIGMGLNMEVNHVAFAATRKFDGFQYRNLNPAELAQVAGRAGRYMNDGTFGVSGEAEPFEQDVIDRIENHNFDSVKVLQWRNRDLDFRSLDTLRKSLGVFPKIEGLTRAQTAADVQALEAISRDESVRHIADVPNRIEKVWDACQIPDYRNISPAEHAHLVGRVITFLNTGRGQIPEDWLAKQLAHCDNVEGGIDALSTRISHVRTWTFIANRVDWLEAPIYWQNRAKEIEDRLSDVLHERLTQRFIDRRTSVLMRRLAKKEGLMSSIEDDGAIAVEGEAVGHIKGLSFVPDQALAGDARMLKAAAVQALAAEVAARAKVLSTIADTELKLNRLGDIIWQQNPVGRLQGGDNRLKPRADVIADDVLAPADRELVRERLQKFTDRHVASLLEPLLKLEASEGIDGITRGLAYRLVENYGVVPRDDVADDVKNLSQDDRAKLRGLGARFGAFSIFLPALLKPAATDLRLLLWWLEQEKQGTVTGEVPAAPANGLTSVNVDTSKPEGYYRMCGYRICGTRAVRVDMVERLSDLIRDRVFWKPRIPEEARPAGSVAGGGFTVISDMMSLVGCSGDEFSTILTSLAFRSQMRMLPKQATPGAKGAAPAPTLDADVAVVTADAPSEVAAEGELLVATEAVPAPSEELVETAVWWPKDMGPFRPQRPKPEARPQRDAEAKSDKPRHSKPAFDKGRGKQRGQKFEKQNAAPPPRAPKPEKKADPNSPFAVLSALKAKFDKGDT